MGTNGCHSTAAADVPRGRLIRFLTNQESPRKPRAPATRANQTLVRRISLFHYFLLFLFCPFFSFFFFIAGKVGFGECKQNIIMFTFQCLCCSVYLLHCLMEKKDKLKSKKTKTKKTVVSFQYNPVYF